MNVDQMKVKLKSGEYILMEKRQAKNEEWKSFHEVLVSATN
jgi:hypothetical protein